MTRHYYITKHEFEQLADYRTKCLGTMYYAYRIHNADAEDRIIAELKSDFIIDIPDDVGGIADALCYVNARIWARYR